MPFSMAVVNLKCNHNISPLGVETPNPRFSWQLQSEESGQHQTAYQILCATSPGILLPGQADVWDSGEMKSENTLHVPYQGAALQSRQRVYWKVLSWDKDGNIAESKPDFFEMGLLKKTDWKARWIGPPRSDEPNIPKLPAPYFRKVANVGKKVVSARAYVTGLGYFELSINGQRISKDVLNPGFTRYDMRVLYCTYDITHAITEGDNAFGILCGHGWHNQYYNDSWYFAQAPWRDLCKCCAQFHLTFADGSEQMICTDTSWQIGDSPIVYHSIRTGETYDARLETPGWDTVNFDASEWKNVKLIKPPGGIMRSSQLPPIQITQTIRPVRMWEPKPGVYMFDLGQNIAGWGRLLNVKGPAGTMVTMRYGEMLDEEENLDQTLLACLVESPRIQTDEYILKGDGSETWEARFTYHGFQYIELSGYPGTPDLDSVLGCVVHTSFEDAGSFQCSNEMFNKIQHASRWSMVNNYHSIPTDCPHREKNGWAGDMLFSAEQMLYNFDPVTSLWKWMEDFKDCQRPGGAVPCIIPSGGWGFLGGSGPSWDSAIILIPWYIYKYTGDTAVFESMYPAVRTYMDMMAQMADNHIMGWGLSDWCAPGFHQKCPLTLTDTALYYLDCNVVSDMAAIMGYAEDAEHFALLAEDVRNAFRAEFLDPETGNLTGDCQGSQAAALYLGMIDGEEIPQVMGKLMEYIEAQNFHPDVGFLGAKYLLQSLSECGRTDIAYQVANQDTYPSWGNWIRQGATTLWETWEHNNASHNHHMFSDISAWFYEWLAGINPDIDEPGFRHICFTPNPVCDLTWVSAYHDAPVGRVESAWQLEGNELKLQFTVPTGAHATFTVPKGFMPPHQGADGLGVSSCPCCGTEVEMPSGKYSFVCRKA